MEEKSSNKEDVYEFKSSKEATPVRGNSTSPDVDKTNTENKNEKSGEGFTGTESESAPPVKRNISEVTDNDENEDDSKKKKRKEGDNKEVGNSKSVTTAGRLAAVRNVNNNADKTGKVGGHVNNKNSTVASKTALTGASSSVSSDRKSPSSPKGTPAAANTQTPPASSSKSESEEDKLSTDGEKADPGLKVPPLKIVIPQQTAAEPEPGTRNGKNSTSRHHTALPYVVSSNSNDSEKDGQRSRSVSPTDSFKDEKKDPAIGMLSAEDQKGSLHHQRVLRSAHRSGPGSNGESRSSDGAATPRNNSSGNNGQGSNPNSGTTVTVITSSNTNPRYVYLMKFYFILNYKCAKLIVFLCSGASTTTTVDNPSPQSQNQSSPNPQTETNSSNSNPAPASGESSSSNVSSSTNYRSSTVANSKPNNAPANNASSSSSNSSNTEDKKVEENTESATTSPQQPPPNPAPVELHPRKRKLKHNKEVKEPPPAQVTSETNESANASTEIHPHDQPVKNCYQLFLDIRKQVKNIKFFLEKYLCKKMF